MAIGPGNQFGAEPHGAGAGLRDGGAGTHDAGAGLRGSVHKTHGDSPTHTVVDPGYTAAGSIPRRAS